MATTKEKIMENVIIDSCNNSIFKINTIKIAKKSGTSESNLYKIFKTKNNMLIETFLYIDEKVGQFIAEEFNITKLEDLNELLDISKKIWIRYLCFFADNCKYAQYYSYFRKSSLYNKDIEILQATHFKSILAMFNYIYESTRLYNIMISDLLWCFILDTTLMMSIRMGNKEIELNDTNIELVYHLMFDGIRNILFNRG